MSTIKLSVVLIIVASASVSIFGCSEKPQVALSPPPEVIVSHPLKKEVTQFLEFTGTTAPLEFVEIRARVEGWLESIRFEPGSEVKQGDLLFVIDPRPFQAQVDKKEAALKGKQAELKLKEANLKRAQRLVATGSITPLQYDVQNEEESVAEAQVGIAKAELEEAKLKLAYTQVTAPISGHISRSYVGVGNLVGAKEKTLLTEIVDDSSVYVYFDVSGRDLLMLMRIWGPNIRTKSPADREKPPAYLQLPDESGYPYEGKVVFAEPRADPNTHTLKGIAIFSNKKGLLVPGLSGRVRVPIRKEALLVPESSVGIGQAGRYVMVVNKDHVVEQRLVKTGQLEGSLRVIDEGLAKDEWVVTDAIQRASPGAKVTPKESPIPATPPATEKAASSSKQ